MAKTRAPQTCIRCSEPITQQTGVVRKVCSTCDLILQTMHHSVEYKHFGKTYYKDEFGSFEWIMETPKYKEHVTYAKPPTWRSWYKIPSSDKVKGANNGKANDHPRGQQGNEGLQGGVSPPVKVLSVINAPSSVSS